MNIKYFLVIGIALFALSQTASAQWYVVDEHGNNRTSGEYTMSVYAECLSDFVTVNVEYTVVVHSTQAADRWMFSQNWRQSGTATDSIGNSWKFNGHWSAIETNQYSDWTNFENFHLVETDILRSKDAQNLILRWHWFIQWKDGVPVIDIRDQQITCLPN